MKTGWVIPILEDLKNFASEQELVVLEEDLSYVITKHRDHLLSEPEDPADGVVPLKLHEDLRDDALG